MNFEKPFSHQFPDFSQNESTNSVTHDKAVSLEAQRVAEQQQAEQLIIQQQNAALQAQELAQEQASSRVSGNWYENWIFNEESGNDPTRWNTSGCLGLGQACPASKLLVDCPNEDYPCEEQWFTSYMLSSYGSWQAAYEFHLAHNWW